nr:hypothetical protein [Halorussus salinisoli]
MTEFRESVLDVLFLRAIEFEVVVLLDVLVEHLKFLESLSDVFDAFGQGLILGINDNVWVVGFLEWVVDSSKVLNLALAGLLVEVLRVAVGTLLDGAFNVDENKLTLWFNDFSRLLLGFAERGYHARDDGDSVSVEKLTDERRTSVIRRSVFPCKAEVRVKTLSNLVAIKVFDGDLSLSEVRFDATSECRFPRRRTAHEP